MAKDRLHTMDPEDLGQIGKEDGQKMETGFVSPGISASPLVSEKDMTSPEISSKATQDLRSKMMGS